MLEEKRSLWSRFFGPRRSPRMDRVLVYIVHRIEKGASLEDVMREEYVLRQLTPNERERILMEPRILQSARKRMHRDLRFQ